MSSCILSKHASNLIADMLYLFPSSENRPGSFLCSSTAMAWRSYLGSIFQEMTSASGSKSEDRLPCLWSSARLYPFKMKRTATVCLCRPLLWHVLYPNSVHLSLLNHLLLLPFI